MINNLENIKCKEEKKCQTQPLEGNRKQIANTWRKREQHGRAQCQDPELERIKEGWKPSPFHGSTQKQVCSSAKQQRFQLILPGRRRLFERAQDEFNYGSFLWIVSCKDVSSKPGYSYSALMGAERLNTFHITTRNKHFEGQIPAWGGAYNQPLSITDIRCLLLSKKLGSQKYIHREVCQLLNFLRLAQQEGVFVLLSYANTQQGRNTAGKE